MKYISSILLILFFTTCAFKCVKADDGIGGKGGSAYITLMPKLNSSDKNLGAGKMYIKYNATEAPANNLFDDSVACVRADTSYYAIFSNIKTGNYFFRYTGLDNSNGKQVTGDLQYKILQFYDNLFNMTVIE